MSSAGAETGSGAEADDGRARAGLGTIAREWTRIGCIGFGGPPAHIALLRKLCVDQRGWLSAAEFEDGIAVSNLLPGPASTQLAMFCAWRMAGPAGALVGGACFIVPGLIVILSLSVLFLAAHPPLWVTGAAAGAGAAVPAVAAAAAVGLMPASWRRAGPGQRVEVAGSAKGGGAGDAGPPSGSGAGRTPLGRRGRGWRGLGSRGWGWRGLGWRGLGWRGLGWRGLGWRGLGWRGLGWPRWRWLGYLLVGGVAGALAGAFLVLVLAACGLAELAVRRPAGALERRPAGESAPIGDSAAGNSAPDGDYAPGDAGRDGDSAPDGDEGRDGGAGRDGGSAPDGGGGRDGGSADGDEGRDTGFGRGGGAGWDGGSGPGRIAAMLPVALLAPVATGGLLAVAWVAFKVGALSYGGGFVIVPLMQHDAVHTYHWMTGPQFLSAVALGQVTPGPVVQTVAVVGFAAAGIGGGLLASLVAFSPSFAFVLGGAPHFASLRRNGRVQAFLTGAGPAAIGAIAGSTIPLGLELSQLWQVALLGAAAVWLLGFRKNVVAAIVGAAGLGVIAVLAGAPVA